MKIELQRYSKCLICNRLFNEGDEVRITRSDSNEMGLVHQACVAPFEITTNHDNRETQESLLNSDEKLWRYMDFPKFVCLLKDSALYFSSPDMFDDIYEGAHGQLKNKSEWDSFYRSFFISSIITAPDNRWHKIDHQSLLEQSNELLKTVSQRPATGYYISCWHNNNYESEAMWKLYSQNMNQAVAIQTTFELLNQAVCDKATIKKVKYIDYSKRFVGDNDVYYYKRRSFEHEKEVRAIIRDYRKQKPGVSIKVDLDSLIQNVYISPYASNWFKDVVKDVISKYGFSFKVHDSSMLEIPF